MEGAHNLRGRKRRRYCEHCEKDLTKSTYYRHKNKFFDHCNGTWIKASEAHSEVPENGSSGEEDDSSIDEYFLESAAGSITRGTNTDLIELTSPPEPPSSNPESLGVNDDQGTLHHSNII